MSQLVEVKVPDIGDFDTVEVIEVLVKPGDTITVTVERDGKAHDLKVTLVERPGNL